MEEADKGYPIIRMGVSGWMFLLVPACPGSPGPTAVKWLCMCVCVCVEAVVERAKPLQRLHVASSHAEQNQSVADGWPQFAPPTTDAPARAAMATTPG